MPTPSARTATVQRSALPRSSAPRGYAARRHPPLTSEPVPAERRPIGAQGCRQMQHGNGSGGWKHIRSASYIGIVDTTMEDIATDHLRLAGRATDDDTATIIWKTQLRRSLTLEGGSQPPISIEMQQQRRTRTTDGPTTMHRIAAPK